MLILVATSETQGQRKSDFNHCLNGEPVQLGFECDSDKDKIDGGCGCRRSFTGLHTSKATTTAKVIEVRDWDIDLYRREFLKTFYDEGWGRIWRKDPTPYVHERARKTLELAAHFYKALGVGAIIEKRGDTVQVR